MTPNETAEAAWEKMVRALAAIARLPHSNPTGNTLSGPCPKCIAERALEELFPNGGGYDRNADHVLELCVAPRGLCGTGGRVTDRSQTEVIPPAAPAGVPEDCPWNRDLQSICPKHGGPLLECPTSEGSWAMIAKALGLQFADPTART